MSFSITNMPPGTYTIPQIDKIATTNFPDAYNTLLPSSELAWEAVRFSGFHRHALILGYTKVAGRLHKVLGCMDVFPNLFVRNGILFLPTNVTKVGYMISEKHLCVTCCLVRAFLHLDRANT
jgi:hypothetical protein